MKAALKPILYCFLLLVFCGWQNNVAAQMIRIHGNVYDLTRNQPLQAVSVLCTSGIGTLTDSTGAYSIMVNEKDSIWFSYLNKSTPKFAVSSISNFNNFDVALHVPVTELKEVKIIPRSYKLDSIQNRKDYAKIFNYHKPGISLSNPQSGNFGVGLDLDAFINMFSFRKNRRMLAFQQHLLEEEREKYIDHRFTKALVKKITGLTGTEQEDFMKKYRPSVEFVSASTDYEFEEYIKLAWEDYTAHKK